MEPKGILNVYTNYDDRQAEGTELDLYVGIAMEEPMPDRFKTRFDVLLVEASTWGVFTTIEKRANEPQYTWARISSEWFPVSGYEMTDGPEMLIEIEGRQTAANDLHMSCWALS